MNIAAMIKQAQDVQNKMNVLQEKLAAEETIGTSGGGAVQITLSGKGDCKSIRIDAAALSDKEILEDLIVAAHRDAKSQIERHLAEEMSKITGGLNLPPGFKLPF